jgi:hypothetical protein
MGVKSRVHRQIFSPAFEKDAGTVQGKGLSNHVEIVPAAMGVVVAAIN